MLAIIRWRIGRDIWRPKLTTLVVVPEGVTSDRQRSELRHMPFHCGDEDDSPRMKAVTQNRRNPDCVSEFDQGIGKIFYFGVMMTQRVGLAETWRVGCNAGEMTAPFLHYFRIFA